ncbi:MAG: hypothetical protein IT482_05595 [Gammaproteobacteria bacterium]|nr:hypothetical protein [Gammaproteobacteria bacterium]
MSVTAASSAQRKRQWYLVHALVVLGLPALLVLFSFATYFASFGKVPALYFPVPLRGLLALGVFSLLWLWVRMLVDFFRDRPPTHPVAWGWFLFLGAYIGALAYFWAIWRPRNSLMTPNPSLERP